MNGSVWPNHDQIPNILIAILGEAIGTYFYSHTKINSLFMSCNFPGDPPSGNCIDKCRNWMREANADSRRPPLQALGELLGGFTTQAPPDTVERKLLWSKIDGAFARANLRFDGNQAIQHITDTKHTQLPKSSSPITVIASKTASGPYYTKHKVSDNPMVHNNSNKRIFIGHGRSTTWKELKDFLTERLKLQYDEFNREPTAGFTTKERLLGMLEACNFAFIVMTAEDEHNDGSKHARENVIHEAGLFQGRYGFERAIILLEEDCSEFSNVFGIGQIRFPKGSIKSGFEEVRRILERECLI